MKKLTTEDFKNRSILKHEGKYTYPNVVYVNNKTKVCITCPIHGDFWQTPNNHLNGAGCYTCAKVTSRCDSSSGLNKFIEQSRTKHGDRYGYSKFIYINSATKGIIICPEHGEFKQAPNNHLRGKGCRKCGINSRADKQRFSVEFIDDKIKEKPLSRISKYRGALIPVLWKCKRTRNSKICGHEWTAKISDIFNNRSNCPKCSGQAPLTNEEVDQRLIENKRKLKRIGDYVNFSTPIEWECGVLTCHNVWKATPSNILSSQQGCPKCNFSKGELRIEKFLIENGIEFIPQKRFKKCKYKKELPFDFYLPNHNICIEFDGQQHSRLESFARVNRTSLEESIKPFSELKKRDKIKTNFCKDNGINLLRISYKQINTIESLLSDFISTFR